MDPVLLQWRKSSYSSDSGNCVEVASAPNHIYVRDSKDPQLTAISYNTGAWRAFIRAVRTDAFDGPTRRD